MLLIHVVQDGAIYRGAFFEEEKANQHALEHGGLVFAVPVKGLELKGGITAWMKEIRKALEKIFVTQIFNASRHVHQGARIAKLSRRHFQRLILRNGLRYPPYKLTEEDLNTVEAIEEEEEVQVEVPETQVAVQPEPASDSSEEYAESGEEVPVLHEETASLL